MKKRIVVADVKSPNNDGKSEGHYFAVAENYFYMLNDEFDVTVAGGPIYKSKFEHTIELPYDCLEGKGVIINKVHTICNFFFLLRKCRGNPIVFQCSASNTVVALLLLVNPKSDIYLIQYDKSISESKFKRLILKLVKKKITGILCPGQEIGESLGLPYCVVPDYVYSEKQWGRVSSTKTTVDFGIYGILANGKGIYEAAEYFSKTRYKLRIAGKAATLPEDQIMIKKLRELCDKSDNIELEIAYLSEEKYKDYIASSRYIVLNYSESYKMRSSGVIFDAIYSGKPVLARRRQFVEFVAKNNLGVVYNELSDVDLGKELSENEYNSKLAAISTFLHEENKKKDEIIGFLCGKTRG